MVLLDDPHKLSRLPNLSRESEMVTLCAHSLIALITKKFILLSFFTLHIHLIFALTPHLTPDTEPSLRVPHHLAVRGDPDTVLDVRCKTHDENKIPMTFRVHKPHQSSKNHHNLPDWTQRQNFAAQYGDKTYSSHLQGDSMRPEIVGGQE